MTSLVIDRLGSTDIASAMQLVEAAGWNQTPNDWSRVIDNQPDGCFAARSNDQLVGTVTSTAYARKLAWIGMMLVHPDQRRQGIGQLLMERVLTYLQSQEIETIKLDATPAGKPLYEKLGFTEQFTFQRWIRPALTTSFEPRAIDVTTDHTTQNPLDDRKLAELDRLAFGTDRASWIGVVARTAVRIIALPEGYGMLRSGRTSHYIGPMVASNIDTARAIVTSLMQSIEGPILWDVVFTDPSRHQLATDLGFRPLRDLTRMVYGGDHLQPRMDLQWAICDPASG